jgi:hypothetical protein
MRLRNRYSIFFGILLFLPIGIANAQFDQYTPPGGPQQPETREARLKRELSKARYHLGPVRLAPELSVHDVAYVRNLFAERGEPTSDTTATVSAGVRAYLHTGPKLIWIARVLPEYVWWQRRSEARRLNLSYGLEAVGLFNRVILGAAAARQEQQRILTPEVPQLANARSDQAQASAEVLLGDKLSTVVHAHETRYAGLVDKLAEADLRALAQLDRTEKTVRAGVRWRPRSGWTLGAGAERTQVDFAHAAVDDFSNEGTSPYLEAAIDRRRVFLEMGLEDRTADPQPGSRFAGFHGLTGNFGFGIKPERSLQMVVYGNRNLIYALSPLYSHFLDTREGLALSAGFGDHLTSRLFAETGTDRYTAVQGLAPRRTDDVLSYGMSLSFSVTERLIVVGQVTRSRYTSNQPGVGRSFTQGGITVSLGGDF